MSVEYTYAKAVHPARLTQEIEASSLITIALDYINSDASTTSVFFKATLPVPDQTELDSIVAVHVNEPLPDPDAPVPVALSEHTSEEGIPFVYSTPRPMGYCSYFTSAGDDPVNGTGEGARALFDMKSTDVSKAVDLSFSENVYIKDGLALPKGAPFGATVCISVVHPVYGHLMDFCKYAPLMGDFPSSMDTEDRALIPAGLIIRITVHNSTGLGGEDPPADFKVVGRLELYRPMVDF